MTTSWADRFFSELPDLLHDFRTEALWRETAPNGLDLVVGQSVTDFGGLRGAMSSTIPDEWLAVAELLEGLLNREPMKRGPRYSGERIILGTFAAELRGYALSAEQARHEA